MFVLCCGKKGFDMKVEIEVKECQENEMYMHQNGFKLGNDEKDAVWFNTTVPGGFPYIFIREGKNEGKRFIIEGKELQKLCEYLMNIDIDG